VHFDHIMAVLVVQQATGAALCVPALEAPALTDPVRSLFALFGGDMPQGLTADRLLEEGDIVCAGKDIALTVLHTPGHTPGSSCYMAGNVIFTGDTLFAGTVGRTDFPGGDTATLLRSLSRFKALEGEYTLYPGHDGATTLSRELQYNPYLRGYWDEG
jgi:glyoxylase-like metal-dependent hydrolase (beta-lactamase superfamily II)